MTLSGRCACGREHYKINEEPLFTHACHCTDCQRTTGSAFVVHLVVAEVDFEIEGETRMSTIATGSGAGCDLHFCTQCGTYIWCRYRYHQVPVIAVRGGTLDDTSAVSPQVHIFTRSKQPWVRLPDDVPAYEEACGREGVWPETSVSKYNLLGPIDQRN